MSGARTTTDPAAPAAPAPGAAPPASAATVANQPGAAATIQPPANLLGDPPAPGAADPAKPADPAAPAAPAAALKPEDYKLPTEGLPAWITPEDPLVKTFLGEAAAQNLSNDQVNAVLAKVAPAFEEQMTARLATQQAEAQALVNKPYETWKELQTQWRSEFEKDPVIGGAKLPDTIAGIQRFIGQSGLDSAEINKALITTGAGNNPWIGRLLHYAASKLSEGTPVTGSPTANTKSAAEKVYNHPQSAPRTAA